MTTQTMTMNAKTIEEMSAKINALQLKKKIFATQVFWNGQGYDSLSYYDEDPHKSYGVQNGN